MLVSRGKGDRLKRLVASLSRLTVSPRSDSLGSGASSASPGGLDHAMGALSLGGLRSAPPIPPPAPCGSSSSYTSCRVVRAPLLARDNDFARVHIAPDYPITTAKLITDEPASVILADRLRQYHLDLEGVQ